MKYLVLIQARCGSLRLPNKVMKDICGKPELQWVVERVSRSKQIDEVMVITSIEKENLSIVRLCAQMGIRVFIGSEHDVLDRYYQAAKLIKPEYMIRITADCPMFDWRILDQAIDAMEIGTDYMWMGKDGFPDGLDLEIMTYAALKKSWEEARLESEREHVTMYIKNHPETFNIQVFDFPIKDIGHYRWTLDESSDFEMIKIVYRHFIELGKVEFVTEDIVSFLRMHPEVEVMNADIGRNEGLAKSMANDRVLTESEGMY